MNERGLFLTFEGGDGSGKATQTKKLQEQLLREGYSVGITGYPRYGEASAEGVEKFLRDEGAIVERNGTLVHVNSSDLTPYEISELYTIDRLDGKSDVLQMLDTHDVVISDRYIYSSAGHNGSRFDTPPERIDFFEYLRHSEFSRGIPKPDHNFLLRADPRFAQLNVDKKAARSYTDLKRDINEADADHLARTFETYQLLAETYPDEFTTVDTMEQSRRSMRTIDDIRVEIFAKVMNLLFHRK